MIQIALMALRVLFSPNLTNFSRLVVLPSIRAFHSPTPARPFLLHNTPRVWRLAWLRLSRGRRTDQSIFTNDIKEIWRGSRVYTLSKGAQTAQLIRVH